MKKVPLKKRFDEKWNIDPTTGCWIWAAGASGDGYGAIKVNKRMCRAHRVAWEIYRGPIPVGVGKDEICVLHHCDTPKCVNPDHLFLGTHSDNAIDRNKKGRNYDRRGEGNAQAKLTVGAVRMIRRYYQDGCVTREWLAQVYGVKYRNICRIVNYEGWTHV